MGAGGREPGYQAIAARDQVLDDQVQVGKGGQPVSQRLPDGVDADGPARGMLDDIGGQELVQVVQPLVVRTRLGPLNTLVIGDNSRWGWAPLLDAARAGGITTRQDAPGAVSGETNDDPPCVVAEARPAGSARTAQAR